MAEMSSLRRSESRRSTRKAARKRAAPRTVFAERLRTALIEGLRQAGIRSQVQIEPVPTTRLHRVLITARKFKNLSPAERQNLVWRIVNSGFDPEQHLQISMIVTLTPEESKGG